MKTVMIVGVGRVGGALLAALPPESFRVERLVVRDRAADASDQYEIPVEDITSLSPIRSDIVIISTQDTELASAVELIAPMVENGATVLHTSGSLSSSVLAPLKLVGCPTGSLHPLVSISDPKLGALRFRDAYFCVEGDEPAVTIANEIARSLGGKPFTISTENKTLYHAAAVMACGHLVALFDAANELMSMCVPDADFAKEILVPLVESTVRNLASQSNAAALTGTFARADAETFDRHLAAIDRDASSQIRELYLLLGERSLDLALENGADADRVRAIRDRISMAKTRRG